MLSLFKSNLQVIVGLLFGFYLFYTYFNAAYINSSIEIAVLLAGIIYIQSVGEFLYFYKRNGKPRLQDWFKVMLFAMLVLNFMSIVNASNGSDKVEFVVGKLSLNSSTEVILVIIVAFSALDVAYIIFNILKRSSVSEDIYFIKKKNAVFALLIIVTFFKLYLLKIGVIGFGNINQKISGIDSLLKMFTSYVLPFSTILAAYILFIERNNTKLYKYVFYTAILVQVATGFLSGMKENAIAPLLTLTIVYLLAGYKIQKKYIYITLFFIVILYPINNAYRTVISNPFMNTGSSTLNMAIAINKIMSEPLSNVLDNGTQSYADRGKMYPFLLYVFNHEYKWDYYKYMDRYIYLPVAWFLPQALLPDKPKADVGAVLYKQITGRRTQTSVTPTTIGWAYLEGGVFFVFIIFILIGLVFEIVDNLNMRNPLVLLFYVIILFRSAIKPEWDPYFMFNSLMPMFVIYLLLLLKFIGVKRFPA